MNQTTDGVTAAMKAGSRSNQERSYMKKTALLALVSVAATLPAFAQNKIDDRLGNSAEVLKQILAKPDEIPKAYLNKAVCVLVFPTVKKVAVGIGRVHLRGAVFSPPGN